QLTTPGLRRDRGGVLLCLRHIWLVERVDADDSTGDGRGVFPEEELRAEAPVHPQVGRAAGLSWRGGGDCRGRIRQGQAGGTCREARRTGRRDVSRQELLRRRRRSTFGPPQEHEERVVAGVPPSRRVGRLDDYPQQPT